MAPAAQVCLENKYINKKGLLLFFKQAYRNMARPSARPLPLRPIAVKERAVRRYITSFTFEMGLKGGSGPGPGLLHNKELKT